MGLEVSERIKDTLLMFSTLHLWARQNRSLASVPHFIPSYLCRHGKQLAPPPGLKPLPAMKVGKRGGPPSMGVSSRGDLMMLTVSPGWVGRASSVKVQRPLML